MKLAHWKHEDGREILVYSDHKVRYIPGRSDDAWRTLQRATVPNLTDEQWIAAPSSEWKAVIRETEANA